jgi:hypothetical protein
MLLNWRRTIVSGNYTLMQSEGNSTGAFAIPANGDDLAAEWGVVAPRHRASALVSMQPVTNFGVTLTLRAQSGAPYTVTTGFDDNHDGVFNDRPDGTPRGSARMASQWDLALRLSYAVGFGRAAQAGPGGPAGGQVVIMGGGGGGMPPALGGGGADGARYRVEFYVSAQNLTNHDNYVGYSGVLTSPFFGQPTNVMNPRKIELGARFGF